MTTETKTIATQAQFLMASNSMEPTIKDNERLLGELYQSDNLTALKGKIVGVVIDSQPGSTGYYVGRLGSAFPDGSIILTSDNPEWEPLAVPIAAVEAVYHITGRLILEAL